MSIVSNAALSSSKTQLDAALVWHKKQAICNFNKCRFYAMAGPKTWLKFFIDVIFFARRSTI